MNITGFSQDSFSVTGFYRVLPLFYRLLVGFYRERLSTIGLYRVLPGFYWIEGGFPSFEWVLTEFLPSLIRFSSCS